MPRKKKTEAATEELTENAQKTEGNVEDASKKENAEEFPEVEIGIDVFSQAGSEEKKETEDKDKKELDEKKEKLKKKLEEKAKELEAKMDKKLEEKEMVEVVKESEKKRTKKSDKTLFPLDDYVKYSAHLGTKAVTPHMRKYVYKRRADGLAVLNTNSIDEKLKEAAEFLKDFAPENVFLACKREAGWKPAKKFSEVTGIKVFTKKYPAGIITNIQLEDFFEVDLVIICDPWLDKNALNDAVRIKKPVLGLCDTNNLTTGVTKIIPCNNKALKSLGLILYLLAREYLKARGKEEESKKLKIEDFTGEIEEKPAKESYSRKEEKIEETPSEEKIEIGAKEGV